MKYKKINLIERNGFLFSDVLSKIKKLKKLSENLNSKTKKENFSLEVIKDLEITNFYSTNSDIKNIFEFFNILKSHTDLFDFINYIEEKKEDIKQFGSEDKNAINLMTVHKSKGLEFDTVFYYKCKRMSKSSRNETSKIKTFIQFDRNFEKVTEFLVTLKKYEKLILRDEKYKKIRELEEEKEKIEEINRDYVALTRAKKNLILLFDIKKSSEKYCDELTEKLIEKYKDCLYLNESENCSNGEIYEEIKEIKKIKNMKETTILDLKKFSHIFRIILQKMTETQVRLI
ncbi:3'-5' exonuclease [Leptotrichia sp. HSP-334]|uniref:3'-5' exonuclease n=1 Tax=Leptotrichia rugosa TaxID=3239302 RepID=UPI00350F4EB5